MSPRVLVLDCIDSFVETLARYAREAGAQTHVVRANKISVAEAQGWHPDGVILSPGPGRPSGAGIILPLIAAMPKIPILGVCLGHQAICEAYGGATTQSPEPMHGRTTKVTHDGSALYTGIPATFAAGRYHSLLGEPGDTLVETAWADGLVMGVKHPEHPHYGVQFHPESLLTAGGHRMIENFVGFCGRAT